MAFDKETDDEELEKPDTDEEEKPQPIGGAISRPVIPQRDYAEEIPPSVTGMNYAAPAPPPVSVTAGPLERPHPAADRLATLESTPAAITQKHGIGGGILKGLEVAGSVLAPNAMERIPGTRLNRDYQIGQAENQATEESRLGATQEAERRAQEAEESEAPLKEAQTDEAKARAEALRNPPPKLAAQTPEQETLHDLMTGDNGNPRVNPATGKPYSYLEAYTQVKQGGAKPTNEKPDVIEMGNGSYQWDPKNEKWNKIGPSKKTESAEGTWTLEEDADGKPILYNSKTAETRPAEGIQKSGTKAKADAAKEKQEEPVTSARDYANNYVENGTFTGPGDEALQEKFFELAKPSTGFRMTQPQIDMLQNSRSWMQSAQAHLRHLASGTWFSDDQRKQIVSTMNDLAKAKLQGGTSEGAPRVQRNSKGDYRYSTDGGKTWQTGKPPQR